jgi:hypothetical protein
VSTHGIYLSINLAKVELASILSTLFMRMTKKLLVFENKFHSAFLYEKCADSDICKLHLVAICKLHLVAICKSQLAVCRNSFEKAVHNNVDEINPQRGK